MSVALFQRLTIKSDQEPLYRAGVYPKGVYVRGVGLLRAQSAELWRSLSKSDIRVVVFMAVPLFMSVDDHRFARKRLPDRADRCQLALGSPRLDVQAAPR